MKIVYIHLCSGYMTNWTYRENILPKYLAKTNELFLITSFEGIEIGDNKLSLKKDNTESKDGKVTIYRIPYKFRLPYFINSKIRLYRGIDELLIKIKPNMIYINGLQFLDLNKITNFKSTHNVKIIAELNATFDNSARNIFSRYLLHKILYSYVINRNLKYFDKLYYGSSSARDFSKKMYSTPSNFDILPLGVDDDKIISTLSKSKKLMRMNNQYKSDDLVIITGGKFDKDKNLFPLLDAFNKLNSKNYKLIIFGDVLYCREKFHEYISTNKNIRYFGWVDDNRMYELLRISDLAIFPGTKSAIWESCIAMGLPLIAQYWKGMDYINYGKNIIYLEQNGDSEEIISILKKVLESRSSILEEMTHSAEENGLSKLSYAKISQVILEDYNNL